MTRTARGREIDMASLIASNEETVTVGNTNTNVRGDVVTSDQIDVPAEVIEEAFQQKQEETERAREQLRSIQLHEEKKLNNFIRKSRVNCIKSKLLAKKKWSIYDSQRRRKRSIDAIVRERGTSLFP